MLETIPFEEGEEVYGIPNPIRMFHTVDSLEKKYALGRKSIIGLLRLEGLIKVDDGVVRQRKIFINAASAETVCDYALGLVSIKDALNLLGISRKSQDSVFESFGLTLTKYASHRSLLYFAVSKEEVENSVLRACNGAKIVKRIEPEHVSLHRLPQITGRSLGGCLQTVMNDQTIWRGVLIGEIGISGLLINRKEIHKFGKRLPTTNHVFGIKSHQPFVTKMDAAELLIVSRVAVEWLHASRTVKSALIESEFSKGTLVKFDRQSLLEFSEKYVSPAYLKRHPGLHNIGNIRNLSTYGMQPVWDITKARTHWYLREECIRAGLLNPTSNRQNVA